MGGDAMNARAIVAQQACNRRSCECQYAARRGHGLTHCPSHDDPGPSLSVRQDGDAVQLHCFAGCDRRDIREKLGIAPRPYYTVPVAPRPYTRHGGDFGPIEATYAYGDRKCGQPLRKHRHAGKTFSWESQTPDGRWRRGRRGLQPGIYLQAEIVHAPAGALVFWAGGEKGADAIVARGELASCCPDGDGDWEPAFADALRDKTVIMLPDNDASGRDFARRFAQDVAGVARHVYVVELPGLAEKEDVFDFLARGGTIEAIVRLALAAGEARPPEPFPDPPQQAQDIERDLAAARERLSFTLGVNGNAQLGAVRHTAVRLVNHVAAAIDRGDVDQDGAARVYLTTMATSAGISRGQLGRHVDRLAAWGFISKQVRRTLEDGDWKSATFITLLASPEETLARLASFRPDDRAPLRPVHRCPDCGDTADVRKVWQLVCDGCGQVLDQGDELVTPAYARDDGLMFTKATSKEDSAADTDSASRFSLSDGTNTPRSGTSDGLTAVLMVPKAPSDGGDTLMAGDCAVCGLYTWRPPGAPAAGWACSDCQTGGDA
jgi:hypothetical protein